MGAGGAGLIDSLRAGRGTLLAAGREKPGELARALATVGREPDDLAQAARRILSGMIPAFGWTDLSVGVPANWHRDPASGNEWPLTYWADLDFRRADGLGEPRLVWEVNRHHHLVTLARAFVATGEPEYARAVWREMSSWIDANPPYYGINWASALEIAVRVLSWAMAIDLIGAEGVGGEAEAAKIAVSIFLQVQHLSANLSTYASSRNNHLIGEAVGLLVAGTEFPFLRGSQHWRAKGLATFKRELPRQIHDDGVDREQSTHYEAFVLELCLLGMIAAERGGRPLGTALVARIAGMARFLAAVSGEAVTVPLIGDEDGGRAYELGGGRGRMAAAAQAAAAVSTGLAAPPGLLRQDLEPAFWLMGSAATRGLLATAREGRGPGGDRGGPPTHEAGPTRLIAATEQAAPGTPGEPGAPAAPRGRSTCFPAGGYFIAAGADQHGVVDCGPLGYLSIAAHGHADCLSLTICYRGRWVLVDPGTYCYHRNRPWRDHFRSTRAHNTVTVDGESQSETLGPFMWGRQARATARRWVVSRDFDLFEGSHDGYRQKGVEHTRTVVFGRAGYWLIVDELEGAGEHEVSATFQLGRGLSVVGRDDTLTFTDENGLGISIGAWLPPGMSVDVVCGSENPPGGWISPGFGVKHEAPAVVAGGRVELPARMVFALAAFEGEPGVGFEKLSCGPDGAAFRIASAEGVDTCFLGSPSLPDGDSRFRGAFGMAVKREGRTESLGVDVLEWIAEGREVAHREIACSL